MAVKSAQRTLEIFEYFRNTRNPASVGELSRALGMPQSSTSVLLKGLVELNYLHFDSESRTFRPTYRVTLLGDWIEQTLPHPNVARYMEALRKETGETIILGMQSGPYVQYIHTLRGTYALQFSVEPGALRPMTTTALGRVLLSRRTDKQIRAILHRTNALAPEPFYVNEEQLLTEIQVIRRQGYAESRGRMIQGVSVIGAVTLAERNMPRLALGVGGPIERIQEKKKEILQALRRYCDLPPAAQTSPSSQSGKS